MNALFSRKHYVSEPVGGISTFKVYYDVEGLTGLLHTSSSGLHFYFGEKNGFLKSGVFVL